MTGTYQRGQLIELNDGRQAIVKFVGQTSFAPGDWIGVVLDDATGKNDGSVQGTQYFQCDPLHGMFVRPVGISRILEDPTPRATKEKAPANGKATAPSAAAAARGGRTSVIGNGLRKAPAGDPTAAKRQSINASSPTPNPRALNGFKSPSKTDPRAATSSASSAATSRGSTPATTTRKSTAPLAPKSTAPRSSLSSGSARPAAATASSSISRPPRPSIAAAANTRETRGTDEGITSRASIAPPSGRTTKPSVAPNGRAAEASASKKAETSRQQALAGIRKQDDHAETVRAAVSRQQASLMKQQEQDDERLERTTEEDSDEGAAGEDKDGSKEQGISREASATSEDYDMSNANGNFAPSAPKAVAPDEPMSGKPASPAPQLSAATTRQLQDLHTRLGKMEQQRDADREELKAMERIRSDRDRLQAIIQKLEAKRQPQMQELAELKRSLADTQSKLAGIGDSEAEHEAALEEAFLDREMAEETAEALRAELEATKTKLDELGLEADVLREENEELSTEMSPEERSNQNWISKERECERYREALLRLRDVREAEKEELDARIAELEADLKGLNGIQQQYDESQEKLRVSEAAVEALKEQLDDALGAEQTIEDLALENDALKGETENLRSTIRHQNDVIEINDELEANHVETEREMQDQLDIRLSDLVVKERTITEKDAEIMTYKDAVEKFREVVSNLHNDIATLTASHQLTETQKEDLNSRSKAMMDLNIKLQSSAAKSQMNTIDLELKRLEAQEAVEHLAIVRMFLPETYDSERDSVLAYLRFTRVAAKSRLLHSALKSKVVNENSTSSTDDVFAICDILDKLVWISAMCDRFTNSIRGCSLKDFTHYTGTLYEMDPVERGLNAHIDAVKRSELRERDAAEGLQGSIALMTHLAEVHIKGDDPTDYAETVLMRTTLIHSYLENTATALALTNAAISLDGVQNLEEDDPQVECVSDINTLISQSRSARMVAGKATNALNELKANLRTIDEETGELIKRCASNTSDLATLARTLGDHVRNTITELPDPDANPNVDVVASSLTFALTSFTSPILPTSDSTSPITHLQVTLTSTATHLQTLHTILTTPSLTSTHTTSLPTPPQTPWSQRAALLSTQKSLTQTQTLELTTLRTQLTNTSSQLASRDATLSEAQVKIELLESRTRDAHAKAARIAELSGALEKGQEREKELAGQIERLAADVARIGEERDRLGKVAAERAALPARPTAEAVEAEGEGRASGRQIAVMKGELEGLRKAVRHLRADNARARLPGPKDSHLGWLHEPLLRHRHPTAAPSATSTSSPNETKDKHRQRSDLSQEGRIAFTRLRSLINNAQLIDLSHLSPNPSKEAEAQMNGSAHKLQSSAFATATSKNESKPDKTNRDRLRWQPLHLKPSYIHARQAEEWAVWRANTAAFVDRAEELVPSRRRGRRKAQNVGSAEDVKREDEMRIAQKTARDAAALAGERNAMLPREGGVVLESLSD